MRAGKSWKPRRRRTANRLVARLSYLASTYSAPMSTAWRCMFLMLAVVTLSAESGEAEQPVAPRDAARDRTSAFAATVQDLPADERAQRIVAWFAAQDTSLGKIAAIGMINDRYVTVVPPAIVTDLVAPLLSDPDVDVRTCAAQALPPEACEAHGDKLERLLTEPAFEAKEAALHAMGRSGAPRFAIVIAARMRDADPRVRIAAAWGWRWYVDNASRALVPLLRDSDPEVRRAAAQDLGPSLGRSGEAVQEALFHALDDADARVRAAAVTSLTWSRDALSRLLPLAGDADRDVRAAVAQAIGAVGNFYTARELEPLLRDPEAHVRYHALTAALNLRNATLRPAVEALAADPHRSIRDRLVEPATRAVKWLEAPP